MKVVCDRAALVEALALAGSVVPSRTSVPVLRSLAITAEDGVLSIDLDDLHRVVDDVTSDSEDL